MTEQLPDARFLCGCWLSEVGAERNPPITGEMACPIHGKGYGNEPERRPFARVKRGGTRSSDPRLATYTVTTSSGAQFKIEMRVLESRKQYGRVDWLCTPVSGEGEIWLSEGSLEMRPTEEER